MTSASKKIDQAIYLASCGDFRAAAALFHEAWHLDKANQRIVFHYVRCLHHLRRDLHVIEVIDEFRLNNSILLDKMVLRVGLSSALRAGHIEKQLDFLDELYRLVPEDPEISILFSARLMQTQQVDRAESVIKRALSWNPRDPGLLTNLAILYSNRGCYVEAEELYGEVLQVAPQQFLGYYNLAMFLIAMGRHEEARLALNHSLQIVPSAPEAIAALRQIDEREEPNGGLAQFYHCVETHQWERAKQSLLAIKTQLDHFKYLAAASELRTQDYVALSLSDCLETARVVQTARILQPSEALVGNLITSIRTNSTLIMNRAGKPTVHGLQTHEVLANSRDPSLRELNKRILELTNVYLQAQALNPWFDKLRCKTNHHISGWGVVLRDSGYQKRHVHPEGIISGVVYLQTPAQTSSTTTREGNLVFSRLEQYDIIPEVGKIVFFPSYLPHETIPIQGGDERICIAFNVN